MATDLFLVRHAAAQERDPARWPDDRKRPLTAAGQRSFRALVERLRPALPVEATVFSSPYVRAWQTAEILVDVMGWKAPRAYPALEPDGPPGMAVTNIPPDGGSVALVGHQPQIGGLVSLLLAGTPRRVAVDFKKGAIAAIRFVVPVDPGRGTLRWFVTPAVPGPG